VTCRIAAGATNGPAAAKRHHIVSATGPHKRATGPCRRRTRPKGCLETSFWDCQGSSAMIVSGDIHTFEFNTGAFVSRSTPDKLRSDADASPPQLAEWSPEGPRTTFAVTERTAGHPQTAL
jgi:hypothetical protein